MAQEVVSHSRDHRAEETRDAIVTAARKLFATKGYADTSIRDLVQAAGVTRGALYHHFKDKEALFARVFEFVARETLGITLAAAAHGDNLWDRIRDGREAWLKSCTRPEVYRIMLIDGRSVLSAERRREILGSIGSLESNLIKASIEALMDSGDVPRVVPVEPVATLLTGAFDAAALMIAEADDKEKVRREVGDTLTMLLEALRDYATNLGQ
ncbi:MAG TPA: helix-turn-helix domain-containing protein [Candidatus Binataceae bacterium]|nr:helix-turn-helix domain-containing protein [Candidatus Binataceae bacterium]